MFWCFTILTVERFKYINVYIGIMGWWYYIAKCRKCGKIFRGVVPYDPREGRKGAAATICAKCEHERWKKFLEAVKETGAMEMYKSKFYHYASEITELLNNAIEKGYNVIYNSTKYSVVYNDARNENIEINDAEKVIELLKKDYKAKVTVVSTEDEDKRYTLNLIYHSEFEIHFSFGDYNIIT